MATPIPGNRYSEIRIYDDTTITFLREQLDRVVGAQAANRRNTPRYVAEVRKLKRAIVVRERAMSETDLAQLIEADRGNWFDLADQREAELQPAQFELWLEGVAK